LTFLKSLGLYGFEPITFSNILNDNNITKNNKMSKNADLRILGGSTYRLTACKSLDFTAFKKERPYICGV